MTGDRPPVPDPAVGTPDPTDADAAAVTAAREACETRLRTEGLDAPGFQRAVVAGLRAIDDLTVTAVKPFVVHLRYAGSPYVVQLDDVFKRYRHGELEPDDAIEELKAALGVPGAAVTAAGPYPRLARRDAVVPGAFQLACPFDDRLVVFFVRALPNGHIPLTAADVERGWGGDASALMAEALGHLATRTQGIPADGFGDGDALVVAWHVGDGLDAAAVLLAALLDALAEWLPGTLHVGIPARDVLLACGDADPAHLASIAADVAGTYAAAGDEAISDRLYRWDGARLVARTDLAAPADAGA